MSLSKERAVAGAPPAARAVASLLMARCKSLRFSRSLPRAPPLARALLPYCTAWDHMGATASGFLECGLRVRGPYCAAGEEDVEKWRAWLRENWPEFLDQGSNTSIAAFKAS